MNSVNALDELRDIHLPEAVSWWPPAPGWWFLAGLLIGLTAVGYWLYKKWQRNTYKRQAIKHIKQLFAAYQHQPAKLAEQLNKTLKTVAQQSYPSTSISRLSAGPWLTFLDQSANMNSFCNGPGEILATAPYRANTPLENSKALQQCCIDWVRRHQI